MARRLSWIAVVSAALMLVGTAPAAAVGPFTSPETLVPGCSRGVGDAAIAADGTSRVFANCTGTSSGRIWFFRDRPGSAPFREVSPYIGIVYAVAWDGLDTTYVVFQTGGELKIGKRVESSGAYSPLTTLTSTGANATLFTADVVASNGLWWAVWSEQVGPGGEFAQTELFQRRTLLGVQGRTRITTTAANTDDSEPTLAYANGRLTMVWTRATNPAVPGPADLQIAESTGGAWTTARLFASLGDLNSDPDVAIYAGATWVTWVRDGRIVVANNIGGAFHSRTFAAPGSGPTVAVSGSHAFVGWYATGADRAVLAELASGVWTSTQVIGPPSYPLRVLAQGSKARVIYWAGRYDGYGALYIRTQA
jgi:hypothetical protein